MLSLFLYPKNDYVYMYLEIKKLGKIDLEWRIIMQQNKKDKKNSIAIEKLSRKMDNMRIAEYVMLMNQPGRLLLMNFILGLIRGFGMGIGFTILVGLLIYMMRGWVNLPLIGKLIADLLDIIDNYR